jgi:DNA primase large subunit
MLSEREIAKYPFLKSGIQLIESINLKLNDLIDPNYAKVLDRATERVNESLIKGEVTANLTDPLTELLSFPVAVMYVTLVSERFLNRRYSLAEAIRAYQLLKNEHEDKIIQIAVNEFNWDIKRDPENIDGNTYHLKLSFSDYLRVAKGFHEPNWKLINRKLTEGYVSIKGTEAARLIQVEVENYVMERVNIPTHFSLPPPLQERLDKIKHVFEEYKSKLGGSTFPEQVINEAFPPCMKYCLEGLLSGRRASHMERFGLTSFLVNIGMSIVEMIQLYTSVTDFDESLTRYQIEHIAGLKGNRTMYTPPTCSTLRTHGICRNMNHVCKTVNHPLNYYRKKAGRIQQIQEKKAQSLNINRSNIKEPQ